MESKMTLGPWVIKTGAPGWKTDFIDIEAQDWKTVCRITKTADGWGEATEEDEANAKAIAALPELIEAARDVEEASTGNGDMSTAVDHVLLALRKAGIEV